MRRSLRCETGAARPFHDSTVHYSTSCKGPERGAMRRSLRCETCAARPFHDSTVHYITSCKGPERGAMRRSLRCETGDAVTTGRYDASDPAPFGRLRVPTVIHAARSIPSRYTRRRAMTRRTTPRPSAGGVACRDRRLHAAHTMALHDVA